MFIDNSVKAQESTSKQLTNAHDAIAALYEQVTALQAQVPKTNTTTTTGSE